ncbi:hypothetical protein AR454_10660 [Bacillus mycoides]|uniref:hypothetical protein n=1 Tax=Bacillus mycoides TaxID=1405 RepID=UPI001E61FEEB|nr:hypothetical protein [Bacillus mycoides]MCD4642220.1 hypothetical protein [Bacillus mycoides]
MQKLKSMLQSCAKRTKIFLKEKLKTLFKRKNLLKKLRGALFTLVFSVFLALCPPLNAGTAISFILVWALAKFQLIALLAITLILIPLSIYDWHEDNHNGV